jgi:dephospho-CoA kinase
MPIRRRFDRGIGSGKSAVANAFASLGVEIVDADRCASTVGAGPAGYAAIRAAVPRDRSDSGRRNRPRAMRRHASSPIPRRACASKPHCIR